LDRRGTPPGAKTVRGVRPGRQTPRRDLPGATVAAAPSIAEELAKRQREISVSEFFERNKHILGFDSPTKALVTAVKEGVDNGLDASLDAAILPDILVEIRKVDGNEFRIVVEDNGPGIVKKEVANVFGRLLYGSRFHVQRQSAGQQGLGISGAILYGQLTSGRPALIRSKVAEKDVAYEVELFIDTKHNMPHVQREDYVAWPGKEHGVRV
jgi:DNA topoisomerase-6 subunit B